MTIKKQINNNYNAGYYFPLFNLGGFRSSITPFFGGDIKIDYNHYALEPTSEQSLYEHTTSRNVVFNVNNDQFFLNGQTYLQQEDVITYETGSLYQKVARKNKNHEITAISYVTLHEMAECHEIIYHNTTDQSQMLEVVTATPLFARGADNLRDHRHVTSLLQTIDTFEGGIKVKPTLSFDEKGHLLNEVSYYLLTHSSDLDIKGYIPTVDDYLDGGSFHFPKGLRHIKPKGYHVDGYEAMGSVVFQKKEIKPNEKVVLYMAISIQNKNFNTNEFIHKYLNKDAFHKNLEEVKEFFKLYLNQLSFSIDSENTSNQLKWVTLQPLLRRYYGNSFLPHHDYGRGGRGWRDLWQDLLALIMMHDESVYDLLYSNFAGIRIDGSNATIIGDQIGEFKADRNQIVRVWSDHGAWPLITTKLYVDETGDIDFLLKKQTYFKDQFTHYTKKTQNHNGRNVLLDHQNEPYQGTIIEHLLIENLVGYHHVGKHGFTKLEDADWNDGLDMASKEGETIAFTHLYAENLNVIANLLDHIPGKDIELLDEISLLLDENANIQTYFDDVKASKGIKTIVDKNQVIQKIKLLAKIKKEKLNKEAYDLNKYQSYYDRDGKLLDRKNTIALTGQAIALLSNTPSLVQATAISAFTKEKLFNPNIGGYHLNSNYDQILTNMGRAFGFAYNHKENGAIFSHMVVMYAYGLYQYNLVSEAREAAFQLLKQAQKEESHVWAGIPEYFTEKGQGKYSYLTGSASWLCLLLRKQVFGLKFEYGLLTLEPKLKSEDFIDGKASITTNIYNKLVKITYHNPKNLDYGCYQIEKIIMNGKETKMPLTQTDESIEVYLNEII